MSTIWKPKGASLASSWNKGQFINSPLICSSLEKTFGFFFKFLIGPCFLKAINRLQTLRVKVSDKKKIKGRLMFAALIGPNITMPSGPIGYYWKIRSQLQHLHNCFFSMLLTLTKKAIEYSQTPIMKIFNGNVVLGSRLVSLHLHDVWKWICHLPRL